MGWPDQIRHFSPSRDPGLNDPSGERMDADLMRLLDGLREEVGVPFIVTSGYRLSEQQDALLQARMTETSDGAHPLGKAVDGYFAGLPLSLQFAYSCRWRFRGIGLYPWTRGTPPVLHLDVMEREKPRTALWIRTAGAGIYVYAPSPAFRAEFQRLLSEERWTALPTGSGR